MSLEATETKSWYQQWFNAPYYYLLYADRDEKEAAAFIELLIKKLQPFTECKMLDVACGRGRHSIHLASHGFNVTGIDISTESIEEALTHKHDRLDFFIHDMREAFRKNEYDYAFNFFTSFGYFDTRQEHENAIRTIADALKQHGVFLMDYLNVHYVEKHLQEKAVISRNGVDFSITRWFDDTHFYKRIEVNDPVQLSAPLSFVEKVAKFSLDDFKAIFRRFGLEIEEVYGDYTFGTYDPDHAPRLIMLARKTMPC